MLGQGVKLDFEENAISLDFRSACQYYKVRPFLHQMNPHREERLINFRVNPCNLYFAGRRIMKKIYLLLLVFTAINLQVSAQLPDSQLRVHRVSNIQFSVTNFGLIGSQDGTFRDEEGVFLVAPGAEFPANSNIGYLFQGALWIGAAIDTIDGLGQPILDTLVSVGNDGWWGNIFELYPPIPGTPSMWRDSVIADEEIYALYSDTCTSPSIVPSDPNDQRPHIPLGVTINQHSMCWRTPGHNEFFIINYLIQNIYNRPLHDVWVGLYYDGDVYHSSENPYSPEAGGQDDICGFIERGSNTGIAWLADNNGQPYYGQFDYRSPTGVMGMVLLHPLDNIQTNFNWWVSNIDATADWGPRRIENGLEPFPGGGMGTPGGDRAKYKVMSNGEHDYDQAWCALSHDGWIPPPSSAPTIANGYDTRFLISFGPIQLAAGATQTVSIAYVGGNNLHTDPTNYQDHLLGHETDSESIAEYYQGLNFGNLIANADSAFNFYQLTGIDEQGAVIPNIISLRQNYPNPFNSQTTIAFSQTQSGIVKLEIFNILGEKIESQFEGNLSTGWHNISWNADGMPSGLYFARLQYNGQSKNIKMVLMK
jgi:hypothetical protein